MTNSLSRPTHRDCSTSPRFPDFFVVGAAKSGTTTFYQYLCRHPNIFMSTPKEMSFFSKDEVYRRGTDWYTRLFAGARDDQLCGEASTTYSRWPTYPRAAERMHAAAPNAKLIYLIRNPVERLYSFYGHRMREKVTMDLQTFLEATPEAVDSGKYMEQIRQLTTFYPQEQFLVLLTEDLAERPNAVMKKACEFLQIKAFDLVGTETVVANTGKGQHFAANQITTRIQQWKRLPLVSLVFKSVPQTWRDRAYRGLVHGLWGNALRQRHNQKLTPLTPERRQSLWKLYHADVLELEKYLQRDLSHWYS